MLRGQYTYTATSRAGVWDRGAGWKVQSVAGAPGGPPVPEEVVRSAVRTVGGFIPPALPELATRADVDALPRCLRLDVLDDRLICLSHSVAAGPDYSGRPNSFTHGLVLDLTDEEVDELGFLRPGDLWNAGLWLRPLGSQAVERAEPDPELDHLERGPLDDAALAAFTEGRPAQRLLVLAAFERHAHRRAPLVVVGDAVESVAQWVRLLGLLVLPATAWQLSFSTYERLRTTAAAVDWPFAVVGVPAADAATAEALPGGTCTVLLDGHAPEEVGPGRWRLPDGTELEAGPWARLADALAGAELLPAVTRELDDLFVECGNSAADAPLWALGAAASLLEEPLPAQAGQDAAEVVLAHWPTDVSLGRRTTERLLARLSALVDPPSRVTEVLRARSGADGSLPAELALLGSLREAVASPAAFAQRCRQPAPRLSALRSAGRQELDDVLAGALDWVPHAGPAAPSALLRIAGLLDEERSDPSLRTRAGELARSVLLPALLAGETDPSAARWPALPPWLWPHLESPLTAELEVGRSLPGEALSPAVHRWLGTLSLPRGELSATTLRGTGAVEWERAAFAVFRSGARPASATPLERAAAFLATASSSAVNEGSPEDRWAGTAADAVYPRSALDVPTAIVLMQCLPPQVPFCGVLRDVLARSVPSRDSAAAVALLRRREAVPATDAVLALHEFAAGSGPEIVDAAQLTELAPVALLRHRDSGAWMPLAEALLRVDTGALPVRGLPAHTWTAEMPWTAGFELLAQHHTDLRTRLTLAAHLVCRGARAGVHPDEDQAATWLTEPADWHVIRAEAAAATLLDGLERVADLVDLVTALTRGASGRPAGGAAADRVRPDRSWGSAAVASARRVAGELPGGSRARARWRPRLRGSLF